MFRSWKNLRAMRLTVRGWFVLGAVIVLPLAYVGGQASEAEGPGAVGSATMAQVDQSRVYRVPDDVQAAREACYDAAEQRIEEQYDTDVPADRDAYVEWFSAGGPAPTAWGAALTACAHQHTAPGGYWGWETMIFVGYGHLR